jgi:hypothetical protein
VLHEDGTPASVAVEVIGVLTAVFADGATPQLMGVLKRHLLSTLSPEGCTAQAKEFSAGPRGGEPQHLRARNMILNMLLSLLEKPTGVAAAAAGTHGGSGSRQQQQQQQQQQVGTGSRLAEVVTKVFGPEFFLMFLSRGVADTTVSAYLKFMISFGLIFVRFCFRFRFRVYFVRVSVFVIRFCFSLPFSVS